MSKFQLNEQLSLGVCYYPEQWPQHLWADDMRRMKEMDISVIRIAEFAWSVFEPLEGQFSFELFDNVLQLAKENDLKVIIGTPTATPPAWLTEKYPQVLNATIEGHLLQHGLRRHTNYTSTTYHQFCSIITTKLVEHYHTHPNVIGWQIDNEFNCEIGEFYSESDHIAFRQWVESRYVTLETLNEAWGTTFWSQTYSSWDQVYLPRLVPGGRQPNPHLALDEKRFISDSVLAFARIQADIIAELAPHHFITTNGLFGHLNSHQLTNELLDFFSYDSYPQFSTIFQDPNEENPLADRSWSQTLSAVRSISSKFCIMEQQAGPGGWVNKMDMPSPRPGQLRLWSYQSIAHGANMVVYFRWRTATFGQEIYWHGLNDYSNKPNRRLAEAAKVGHELQFISDVLAPTTYEANVAIMRDYNNEWDGEYDVWHGPYGWTSGKEWYKALTRKHIPTDIVYMEESTTLEKLQKYQLIIYPHPAIMSAATASLLEQYVELGGEIIFGCRTGYKDTRGHCYMLPFPGVASKLTGIELEEYTVVKGTRSAPSIKFIGNDNTMATQHFNEIIEPISDNVEILATYEDDYYAGKPALTRHAFGKGQAWYYGSVFSEQVANEILSLLPDVHSPASWLHLPTEVELAVRGNDSRRIYILLNYSEQPMSIQIDESKLNLLTNEAMVGKVELQGYDVLLLVEEK
ncbi:beta-galactosidase [Paenibacillus endoradicis]|uniref:beta-galactosidase n=1 Tax=Paenibacillus endoradicis TaxID=2972487 RepID=UPI002158B15B|nr:beta-galactosidase [Paenibacillus endoradicis]MCR8659611.1 beta-galactosidase [Paenibacillus endoradicis]